MEMAAKEPLNLFSSIKAMKETYKNCQNQFFRNMEIKTKASYKSAEHLFMENGQLPPAYSGLCGAWPFPIPMPTPHQLSQASVHPEAWQHCRKGRFGAPAWFISRELSSSALPGDVLGGVLQAILFDDTWCFLCLESFNLRKIIEMTESIIHLLRCQWGPHSHGEKQQANHKAYEVRLGGKALIKPLESFNTLLRIWNANRYPQIQAWTEKMDAGALTLADLEARPKQGFPMPG